MKGFKTINWAQIIVLAVVMFAVAVIAQLFIEEQTAIVRDSEDGSLTSFTVTRSITHPWKKD